MVRSVKSRTVRGRAIENLTCIPGVGPGIAASLFRLGIREVAELRARSPEALYSELCRLAGVRVDRCVLYVFRCAVYYASESQPDPELLKWWNWKDSSQLQVRSQERSRSHSGVGSK